MTNYLFYKRVLDFLFAIILLFLTSIVMLFAAFFIKMESKGPVLFKQPRPGKNGKVFVVYKFRTMRIETVNNGKKLLDSERMTKMGSLLRKMSIDELPQLLNILRGEMSFIGPRPLLVQYLQHYSEEQMRRHEVTPGISGWAQVNGRNAISWEEKFKLDVYYVEHVSFLLDLKILCMTIFNVISRKGINSSENVTMPFFDGTLKREK